MVHRAVNLDRWLIRKTFEERFSVERMVDEYEDLYQTLTANRLYETEIHTGDKVKPFRAINVVPRVGAADTLRGSRVFSPLPDNRAVRMGGPARSGTSEVQSRN